MEQEYITEINGTPMATYIDWIAPTFVISLLGLPALSVPAGLNGQGLPLGLQLIGRPWEEGELLNVAHALEGAAGYVSRPEKWW